MTANKTLFSENSLKKPIIKTTENLHNNKIHDKRIYQLIKTINS